jgi:hypothetical protein
VNVLTPVPVEPELLELLDPEVDEPLTNEPDPVVRPKIP